MVGVYWTCLSASERALVLKNGFYRMFHRYLCATDAQPAGQRETRLNGVKYDVLHYDCFQQPIFRVHFSTVAIVTYNFRCGVAATRFSRRWPLRFSIHAVFICARNLRNFAFGIMSDPSEQTPIKKRLRNMKLRSQTPQLVKQLTRVKRVRTGNVYIRIFNSNFISNSESK